MFYRVPNAWGDILPRNRDGKPFNISFGLKIYQKCIISIFNNIEAFIYIQDFSKFNK